jgi:hypothetical protein
MRRSFLLFLLSFTPVFAQALILFEIEVGPDHPFFVGYPDNSADDTRQEYFFFGLPLQTHYQASGYLAQDTEVEFRIIPENGYVFDLKTPTGATEEGRIQFQSDFHAESYVYEYVPGSQFSSTIAFSTENSTVSLTSNFLFNSTNPTGTRVRGYAQSDFSELVGLTQISFSFDYSPIAASLVDEEYSAYFTMAVYSYGTDPRALDSAITIRPLAVPEPAFFAIIPGILGLGWAVRRRRIRRT